MKNLMRILSVLLVVALVIILIGQNFDMGNDFSLLTIKVMALCVANILPMISIALCAYCLERNDDNYFLRIIPIYMLIPIIISTIMILFDLDKGALEFFIKTYGMLSSTFLPVTVVSLLFVVKPNNQITTIIKRIAYAGIIINVVLAIVIAAKEFMVETLPNVYGYSSYGGFNFTSVSQTQDFANKMYGSTVVLELFSIILIFITNYAFSLKVEDVNVDNIDYDKLIDDANKLANDQMKTSYTIETTKEEVIDRSASEKGLMNVNNQLGVNSNVGKVDEAAKTTNVVTTSMENIMPLSSGPVINQNLNQGPMAQEVVNNNQNINPPQQEVNKPEVNNNVAPTPINNQAGQDIQTVMAQNNQNNIPNNQGNNQNKFLI